MNGTGVPLVKVEQDDTAPVSVEHQVKPEPDSLAGTPSALSDDDIYEDAGDLDFSNIANVHLLRLPKWLWENWANIDDDEQIELGVVRVENLDNNEQKVATRLLLSKRLSETG